MYFLNNGAFEYIDGRCRMFIHVVFSSYLDHTIANLELSRLDFPLSIGQEKGGEANDDYYFIHETNVECPVLLGGGIFESAIRCHLLGGELLRPGHFGFSGWTPTGQSAPVQSGIGW